MSTETNVSFQCGNKIEKKKRSSMGCGLWGVKSNPGTLKILDSQRNN